MRYPVVEEGHVVPAVYLRNFADGEHMKVHNAASQRGYSASVTKTARRRRVYRRTRPDGTPIDDIEWSISHIERAVKPVLCSVEERWPLDHESKRVLAEFFALQMYRVPRWHKFQQALVRRSLEEVRAAGTIPVGESIHELTVEELAQCEDIFLSDTRRLVSMLHYARRLTGIVGSMHWTLVRFENPILALSDDPIVVWPLDRSAAHPGASTCWTPIDALEVRAPVSPRLAIVMTWVTDADRRTVVDGDLRLARNLNAFTIAQAERHWMHLPGAKPLTGTGKMRPIAPALHARYDAAAARRSRLRRSVRQQIAGDGPDRVGLSREYTVIRASRAQAA